MKLAYQTAVSNDPHSEKVGPHLDARMIVGSIYWPASVGVVGQGEDEAEDEAEDEGVRVKEQGRLVYQRWSTAWIASVES